MPGRPSAKLPFLPAMIVVALTSSTVVPSLLAQDATSAEMSREQAETKILEVLKSPRCLNCHPTDDRPRQGDDMHPHRFAVERGPDDHGWAVYRCETCHREENNAYAGIPGAPHWGLAPKSMGWLGLSDEEILRRLVDPAMNGGRSRADLVEHMSSDALVLWAWEPGDDRTPPPVPLDEFRAALQAWLTAGVVGDRDETEDRP